MPRFCELAPANAYCQDFDTTELAAQGWTQVQTQDTAIELTMTAKSAPFALSASTPASPDDGTPEDAYLLRELPVPGTFNVLRISVDIQFAKREAPSQPKEVLEIAADPYSIKFTSNGTNETYFFISDGVGTPTQTFDTSALATWLNYEITITRSNTVLVVSVKRDGALIPNNSNLGVPKTAPPADKPWQITIGAWNISANGPSTFLFDNLLVTAQ